MQQPGLKDKCDHENELQTRARTMDYSLSVPPLMHEYLDAVQSWKDFSYYEHPVVKGTWSAVIVCTRRLLEDLISGPDFPKHVQMLGDMIIEDLGSGSLWSVVSRAVLESGFPTNLIREEIDQQQRVVSYNQAAWCFWMCTQLGLQCDTCRPQRSSCHVCFMVSKLRVRIHSCAGHPQRHCDQGSPQEARGINSSKVHQDRPF